MVRLQKFLSEAGVASRRASEGLIRAGRVAIDGDVVREVGVKVDELRQQVSVDGEPVRVRRKRYFAVNKPSGYICTRSDPEGRETLFDLLPKEWVNLYPVGRLDAYSEGLILVTNDGDFCLRVTHPRFGIRKLYVATVRGKVERRSLRRMENGLMHRGEKLKAEKAAAEKKAADDAKSAAAEKERVKKEQDALLKQQKEMEENLKNETDAKAR